MLTIAESLQGVNAYPIPPRTLHAIAARRALDPFEDVSPAILSSPAYKLCEADLLMWLSLAPDVSQGGQTYSLTDAQREDMRRRARQLYDEFGDEADTPKAVYGYKGSVL